MADDMTDEMNRAIEFNRHRLAQDREEIESLHETLEKLACSHVTESPLWWQVKARSALAELSGFAADLDIIEEFVRRNVGGQPALDAIFRLRSLTILHEENK